MQYRQGSLGRIMIAKVEHGDDLLIEFNRILEIEKINTGVAFLIGAVQSSSIVVGPEACTVPPEPVWKSLQDGREILGIATIFGDPEGKPAIHLHASLGRGDNPLTGCIRKDTQVYLVVELIIFELLGCDAIKTFDQVTGLNLLGFAGT